MAFTFGRPKHKPKRVFWAVFPNGEFKCWLRHKAYKGSPEGDIVVFKWTSKDKKKPIEMRMKLWEASVVIAGLANALTVWLGDSFPEDKKELEYYKDRCKKLQKKMKEKRNEGKR